MKSTKTLFRLLVSGALTASMLLPSSLAVYQAKVKADSLYLRSAPGGSVIATLSQGTTVAVTNNSSEWYKVIVDGKEGYVSGSYLTGTTATDFSVGSGKITLLFYRQPQKRSEHLVQHSHVPVERHCRHHHGCQRRLVQGFG